MNDSPLSTNSGTFSFLKFEQAPAFGSGSMAAATEPLYAMLAHLFPLIIWFWKPRESPAVDAHGKEALNFGITVMICIWPLSFLAGFLPGFIARIVGLGAMIFGIGVLALVVCGMIHARSGRLLRYPLNFRLIK
jgi:uncharacterized Tic20 family protein